MSEQGDAMKRAMEKAGVARLVKPEREVVRKYMAVCGVNAGEKKHLFTFHEAGTTMRNTDIKALAFVIKKFGLKRANEFNTLSLMENLPSGKDDYRPVYYREAGRQDKPINHTKAPKPEQPSKLTKRERIEANKRKKEEKKKDTWFQEQFLGTNVKERLIVKRCKVILDKAKEEIAH